uniref:CD99 antigen-like isoform X3 n=1 Tax=Geotrypetes seraphini TaxID=260995 RepID=A0A6P8RH80_GEOSA|nr:CD99 antigen-like isoform X3 [Geotrypetes seraphini]
MLPLRLAFFLCLAFAVPVLGDETVKIIEEITNRMRKIAHVPVQTWKGIKVSGWFDSWFQNNDGDFNLEDAFDKTTTKSPIPTKKPKDDGGFNLEDAFGEETKTLPPKPKPKPGGAGGGFGDDDLAVAAGGHPNQPSGGNFGDGDLYDITGGKPNNPGGSDDHGKTADDGEGSKIGGIVGGIAAMVVAAIGSFIAYQKKKLCFREGANDQPVDPKKEVLNERWRRVTNDPDY